MGNRRPQPHQSKINHSPNPSNPNPERKQSHSPSYPLICRGNSRFLDWKKFKRKTLIWIKRWGQKLPEV